ncbi:hypothetical protein [Acetobacter ghanensis]|uniref:Uncharacterized protein n=2 Tax=Acetobacter ghanensis TaxID=431306 RepID=A0ABX0KGR0_9PROT|nr:hypothetical protein [Acetobacter ghanensis]NHO38653.1 hypothetical protein [Acetobacter ghanensis]
MADLPAAVAYAYTGRTGFFTPLSGYFLPMLLRSAPPDNMPKMPTGWGWQIKLGCLVVLVGLYGGFMWHVTHQKIRPIMERIDIPLTVVAAPKPPAPPAPPIAMLPPPAVDAVPPPVLPGHGWHKP